jgi:hypothetical protein
MIIPLQMQIKKNKNYYEYLKENSNWFKDLNRNPQKYDAFVEFIKVKYKLRVTDKVSNAIDSIDLISNVVNALK